MKIGTVKFKGKENDKNTYVLAIDPNCFVWVFRSFRGVSEELDRIPSGWRFDFVNNNTSLTIDGGQDWVVYPTKEAWEEIRNLMKTR